jgi:hypothetical protein
MNERAALYGLATGQARSPHVVHMTKAGSASMLKEAR